MVDCFWIRIGGNWVTPTPLGRAKGEELNALLRKAAADA